MLHPVPPLSVAGEHRGSVTTPSSPNDVVLVVSELGLSHPAVASIARKATVFTYFSGQVCCSLNRLNRREASVLPHGAIARPVVPCMSSVLGQACRIASRHSTVLPVVLSQEVPEVDASKSFVCAASPSTRA